MIVCLLLFSSHISACFVNFNKTFCFFFHNLKSKNKFATLTLLGKVHRQKNLSTFNERTLANSCGLGTSEGNGIAET